MRSAAGRFQSEVGQNLVKVVAPDCGNALRPDDVMDIAIQSDQGGVKRATAQIVDENVLAAALGVALTMAKLDAGAARLVQDAGDLETGFAEGLDGQEALIVVRVCRHAEDGFQITIRTQSEVRALVKGLK